MIRDRSRGFRIFIEKGRCSVYPCVAEEYFQEISVLESSVNQ